MHPTVKKLLAGPDHQSMLVMPSLLRLAPIIVLMLLQGCAQVAYLGQAINGHLWVQQDRRPLDEVINDTAVPAEVRKKLELAARMRQFASDQLGLPDNDSYKSYRDLGRDYVVINVVATPELSLQPRTWCYPVAGCLPYRGYYSLESARALAEELEAQGWEVYLGRVPAYSTLGWFDDPLLNTMLEWGEADLAGLIFHELVHQQLYVADDAEFNESLAVAIEQEGVRRWFEAESRPAGLEQWQRQQQRQARVRAILQGLREQLEGLYAGPLSDKEKRLGKTALMADARTRYELLKQKNGWEKGFDAWFDRRLNNAFLALLNTYHRHVPAFEALLRQLQGDLPAFHARVAELAELPRSERERLLDQLSRE